MRTLLFALAIPLLADSVAGLKWTAPDGWKSQGPRPMRAATYMVPPAAGDSESAECAVYFFGAGQGGSIEANLDRWKGQMLGPGGQPADAKVEKRTINGFPVTTIVSAGEYTGMGGPMAASKSKQSGYRLLGAIVEGPGGNVFLKFAGPAKTVTASQPKFELLLKSFQKEK
ncbi:MAG TPA: hypothetical protein VNX18_01450 [Bryobacteraceae bacterium]|nr:hypothetical protein [Bryobacteraceae bacterium]